WQPHITLLGMLRVPAADLLAKLQDVAKSTPPISVRLVDIVTKDLYFQACQNASYPLSVALLLHVFLTSQCQCVMAKVEETPELMRLNAAVRDRLLPPPTEPEPYWPHLSLVYGDIPEATRAALRDEIAARGDWPAGGLLDAVVLVDRVQAWVTDGAPESWTLVGEVKLEG
ncbi:hypothetical protein HK405_010543, partial [Cladochytrium tenue]